MVLIARYIDRLIWFELDSRNAYREQPLVQTFRRTQKIVSPNAAASLLLAWGKIPTGYFAE